MSLADEKKLKKTSGPMAKISAQQRAVRLKRELPILIELMILGHAAGMSALEVIEKSSDIIGKGSMADELSLVIKSQKLGDTPIAAWIKFRNRNNLPEIRILVAVHLFCSMSGADPSDALKRLLVRLNK